MRIVSAVVFGLLAGCSAQTGATGDGADAGTTGDGAGEVVPHEDGGVPIACDAGVPLTNASDDCVAYEHSACGCGAAQYFCVHATAGGNVMSTSTPLGATAGPNGSACSSQIECARAKLYDAKCGGAEAYECPPRADGSRPIVNITGTCWAWDGGAPNAGEAPLTCCP